MPVIFNEFCTTWGNPTEENICRTANALKGRGVDYFVIDAGWYGDPSGWQAVARYCGKTGETLITIHTFGGALPDYIRIPMRGRAVRDILCSEDNTVIMGNGWVDVELKANYEAIAILVVI